jgi:hypothetical protein
MLRKGDELSSPVFGNHCDLSLPLTTIAKHYDLSPRRILGKRRGAPMHTHFPAITHALRT